MIYKGEQAIKDSLNVLKIENHRKRESYVHKLLDYYNGSNTKYYIENRFDLVLIMEQFLESLILLKDLLNLDFEDLIYITQNVRREKTKNQKINIDSDYEHYFDEPQSTKKSKEIN